MRFLCINLPVLLDRKTFLSNMTLGVKNKNLGKCLRVIKKKEYAKFTKNFYSQTFFFIKITIIISTAEVSGLIMSVDKLSVKHLIYESKNLIY